MTADASQPGLVEWLLQQISEDEADARDALPRTEWAVTRPLPESPSLAPVVGTGLSYNVEAARHIERWQPARVLRECEAKRRIVHISEKVSRRRPPKSDGYEEARARQTLRLLAAVYSDRPGYQQEWKP